MVTALLRLFHPGKADMQRQWAMGMQIAELIPDDIKCIFQHKGGK